MSAPKDTADAPPLLHQQQAAQAYKTSNLHGKSDREMMTEALRVIITTLYQAKDAYTAKNIEEMLVHTTKIQHIVYLLAAALEDSGALKQPETRQSAMVMGSLYNELIRRVTNVLRTPNPSEEFEALTEIVKPIYRAWHTPTPEPQSGP